MFKQAAQRPILAKDGFRVPDIAGLFCEIHPVIAIMSCAHLRRLSVIQRGKKNGIWTAFLRAQTKR
jgi:hypothetical protein